MDTKEKLGYYLLNFIEIPEDTVIQQSRFMMGGVAQQNYGNMGIGNMESLKLNNIQVNNLIQKGIRNSFAVPIGNPVSTIDSAPKAVAPNIGEPKAVAPNIGAVAPKIQVTPQFDAQKLQRQLKLDTSKVGIPLSSINSQWSKIASSPDSKVMVGSSDVMKLYEIGITPQIGNPVVTIPLEKAAKIGDIGTLNPKQYLKILKNNNVMPQPINPDKIAVQIPTNIVVDSDGDGVPDDSDKCPHQKESSNSKNNDGCPDLIVSRAPFDPTTGYDDTSYEECKSVACSLNLSIKHVEVTQGIQDLENSIPLIEREDTYVRVYVDTNVDYPIENVDATLTVCSFADFHSQPDKNPPRKWEKDRMKSGYFDDLDCYYVDSTRPITLTETDISEQRKLPQHTINFQVPHDGSFTFKGPHVGFRVDLNQDQKIAESTMDDNTWTDVFDPIDVRKTRIDLHSYESNNDWCNEASISKFQDHYRGFASKVYPTHDWEKIKRDSHPWVAAGLNGDEIDTNTEAFAMLAAISTHGDTFDFGSKWNVDYAVVCDIDHPTRDKIVRGMGFNMQAWSYLENLNNQDTADNRLAHELGHALGLGHIPISPLTTDSSNPNNWDESVTKNEEHRIKIQNEHEIDCWDSKPAHKQLFIDFGELIEDDLYPRYDQTIGFRTSIGEYGFESWNGDDYVFDPHVYTDFMAYCEHSGTDTYNGQKIRYDGDWISPYSYLKLLFDRYGKDLNDYEKSMIAEAAAKQPGICSSPHLDGNGAYGFGDRFERYIQKFC